MSSTVFLGNLPPWVTADDIKAWLVAVNLVSDAVKVIRNPETQESKGFAFIEAPNEEEMHLIIKRFDRAPLEDRLLRANPAQPPKSRTGASAPPMRREGPHFSAPPPRAASVPTAAVATSGAASASAQRATRSVRRVTIACPDRFPRPSSRSRAAFRPRLLRARCRPPCGPGWSSGCCAHWRAR